MIIDHIQDSVLTSSKKCICVGYILPTCVECCQVGGVCVTFGHRVVEWTFSELHIFVLDVYCQQMGYVVQLRGVYVPFGQRVGECIFSEIFICIEYDANKWGYVPVGHILLYWTYNASKK